MVQKAKMNERKQDMERKFSNLKSIWENIFGQK